MRMKKYGMLLALVAVLQPFGWSAYASGSDRAGGGEGQPAAKGSYLTATDSGRIAAANGAAENPAAASASPAASVSPSATPASTSTAAQAVSPSATPGASSGTPAAPGASPAAPTPAPSAPSVSGTPTAAPSPAPSAPGAPPAAPSPTVKPQASSPAAALTRIILQLDNKKAQINGKPTALETAPVLLEGRTMVPLRFVGEGLGATVDWDGTERSVTLRLNGETIVLWIDRPEAKVNGKPVVLDVPATILADTTMVPVRFVSENLKQEVTYLQATKQIIVASQGSGKFTNGLPDGKVRINLPDGSTFIGEARSIKGKLTGYGTTYYLNGDKASGGFVDGRPSGVTTLTLADNRTYLIDYKQGQPVSMYRAAKPVNAGEAEAYQKQKLEKLLADSLARFKAEDEETVRLEDLEAFQSEEIELFQAEELRLYKTELIAKYGAEPVELSDPGISLDVYLNEAVKPQIPAGAGGAQAGGSGGPDYGNPYVRMWISHILAAPYLINSGIR